MAIQTKITDYWEGEAPHSNEEIWQEMNSFKKIAWASLIEHYRPATNPLKVLDIGTGPGFLAMLAAEMGHKVTAIDCARNMLLKAQNNLDQLGLEAELILMDSHNLAFTDNSFDLILCRNLTWTLDDPQRAYREWYRVLKPKGRLLIFDANWNLRLGDPEWQAKYLEDLAEAERKGIQRRRHAGSEEGENLAKELFLSSRLRPHWDVGALLEAGFKELFINTGISDKVWDEDEKVVFRSSPLFLVGGEK